MSLYNNHISGTNPFHWWMGQVVDESTWIGNINPKLHDRNDVPGWGACRCKVRIFGRDTAAKDTPDERLAMAEVLLPVTAGSGHGGAVQSPNIMQGNYVFGFYKDGLVGREPIIFGILPNNSQTELFGGDPKLGFVPRSGYKGKTGTKPVSTKNIYAAGPNSPCENESCDPNIDNVRERDQQKDGNRCHYVPKTKACDGAGGELKGIQKFIKNALALINRIKAEANGFLGAASDLTSSISQIVNDVSSAISGLMKSLLDRMRGYIVNKLNAGVKDLMFMLAPNLRATAVAANKTAVDILQCVFNKIIKGLLSLVKKLLTGIIDKYVNAPLCAIENFIGNLLSSVLGDITGAIQSALGAIDGLIGKVGDIAGKVFEVLDFVSGILKFLSCEEELDCTMGDEWSFWGGAKCLTENVSAGIKKTSDKIKAAIEGDDGGGGGGGCNTAQIPCGPPTISFIGGGGSGASGNPIISATGALLGIDLKIFGAGYTSAPSINIEDSCGIGGGAVVIPLLDTTVTTSETNNGQISVNDNAVVNSGGQTIIEGGVVTIQNGNVSSSGGTVTLNAGNTIASNTGGNTTSNGGNITVNGGTTTEVNGVQTVSGATITITGGSATTTGGLTTVSNASPLSGTGGSISGLGAGGAGGGLGNGIGNIVNGGSVVNVVIVDPGSGYLQSPNGSTGGNGSVFSKPNQTIVFNQDIGYNVYSPNETLNVLNGDLIYAPAGTIADVYDADGNVGQTINGQGGVTPITINMNGTITTPTYDSNANQTYNILDPSANGSYPVVLTIGDVAILNGGVNYNPTDKIIISPDNGAQLEPVFNTVGRLVDVKVISSGIGFTDFPNLFIESQTGLNVVIVPVFNILRVGDLPEDQDIVPPGTQIINVVDCVGKVS